MGTAPDTTIGPDGEAPTGFGSEATNRNAVGGSMRSGVVTRRSRSPLPRSQRAVRLRASGDSGVVSWLAGIGTRPLATLGSKTSIKPWGANRGHGAWPRSRPTREPGHPGPSVYRCLEARRAAPSSRASPRRARPRVSQSLSQHHRQIPAEGGLSCRLSWAPDLSFSEATSVPESAFL